MTGTATLTSTATITERFRRPKFGTHELEETIDDAKAYTRRTRSEDRPARRPLADSGPVSCGGSHYGQNPAGAA